MSKGWVTIKRKITGHWLWNEKPFSKGQAWIDLILMAQHKQKELMHRGQKLTLARGQLVTSERKLSSRWGWSRGKVKNFLNKLEKDGMVTIKKKPKEITVVTIVNYCFHQNG